MKRNWLEDLIIIGWILLVVGLCWAGTARAQEPSLIVQGPAHRTFIMGLDTATTEKVFCVWWHDVVPDVPTPGSAVSLDSAYVPLITYADSQHVSYMRCPPALATAHYHLLDRGAVSERSDVDSTTLVNYPSAFGVLILRRRGFRMPTYVYYDR